MSKKYCVKFGGHFFSIHPPFEGHFFPIHPEEINEYNRNVAGYHSELIHAFQLLLMMLVRSNRLLKLVAESINTFFLIIINACAIFYWYLSVLWSLSVFRFFVFVVVAIVSQFASKFKWFVRHLYYQDEIDICSEFYRFFTCMSCVFIIGGWCSPER